MLIVLTALLAGFLHVLSGPDHLTAIARAEARQSAIVCTCSTLAVVVAAYWLISTLPLAYTLAGAALI
jgi:hypothetical protein